MNDKSKTSAPTGPLVRLLADSMLGRLARWLRLMGYDTTYAATLPDHQIAAQARAEGRIVLTRDRELARRKGIRTLLIDSQILESQLQEVVSVLGSPATDLEPRCPQCNASLLQTTADAVRTRVPAHVLEKHQHFCRCSECDKIYWRGSHWQNVELLIAQVLENQGRAEDDNENQSGTSANTTE